MGTTAAASQSIFPVSGSVLSGVGSIVGDSVSDPVSCEGFVGVGVKLTARYVVGVGVVEVTFAPLILGADVGVGLAVFIVGVAVGFGLLN